MRLPKTQQMFTDFLDDTSNPQNMLYGYKMDTVHQILKSLRKTMNAELKRLTKKQIKRNKQNEL